MGVTKRVSQDNYYTRLLQEETFILGTDAKSVLFEQKGNQTRCVGSARNGSAPLPFLNRPSFAYAALRG